MLRSYTGCSGVVLCVKVLYWVFERLCCVLRSFNGSSGAVLCVEDLFCVFFCMLKCCVLALGAMLFH